MDRQTDDVIHQCFLCGSAAQIATDIRVSGPVILIVRCGVCGLYEIDEVARDEICRDETKRYGLAWIVRDPPASRRKFFRHENLDELVRPAFAREPTPSGKARRLLELLKNRSQRLGEAVVFDAAKDWPLLMTRGEKEAQVVVRH